jgi:transposase
VYESTDFLEAFAYRGAPATSPGVLALVSVLQYAERLTDRQAAGAVRGRIGWKYVLGLELADAGFEFSALSGFRSRVLGHGLEHQFLDVILARCAQLGLLRAGGRMRTDSTHVVACVRDLNRVEFVTETLRCALEALSVAAPGWRGAAWSRSCGWRGTGSVPVPAGCPRATGPRAGFAARVGSDGYALLEAVDRDDAPRWLPQLPAIGVLRTAWGRHFGQRPGGGARYREAKELPAGAQRLVSPHDPDARCAVRRTTVWDGYKAHFTETCDPGAPHLVVSSAATPAAAGDSAVTALVHRGLHAHSLAPAGHFAGHCCVGRSRTGRD